jgi:hypothetical protein
MRAILFPGRHHILTRFQESYLRAALASPASVTDVDGNPLGDAPAFDTIVWAITSANHARTRRNPLPRHRREAQIATMATTLPARSLVYGIDDLGPTDAFASHTLKSIAEESGNRCVLTPDNCVVACSTPDVIRLYRDLGFRVLPVELLSADPPTYRAARPWECVQAIAESHQRAEDWRHSTSFTTKVSDASRRAYLDYDLGDLIAELFADPLLNADGDLTDTRDYNTYARAFDDGAARKYALIRDHITPGRIVDIGCATGAIVREMSADPALRESDLFGVEAARPLFEECIHRRRKGFFSNDNVFFHQRNAVADALFPPRSIDTFTTFSLTHEVESYQGRAALEKFMRLLHGQLAPGGRWINVDVVGPDNADQPVLLRLSDTDAPPGETSTLARWHAFARDFRHDEGEAVEWSTYQHHGESLISTTLRTATEFLTKKDYTDNWASEMHERFCFWSLAEWRTAVAAAGLRVVPGSHTFTNPWIAENRWSGHAEILSLAGDTLAPVAWPPTTMVLIAEKPAT